MLQKCSSEDGLGAREGPIDLGGGGDDDDPCKLNFKLKFYMQKVRKMKKRILNLNSVKIVSRNHTLTKDGDGGDDSTEIAIIAFLGLERESESEKKS